jgi:hypothetical protein
MSLTKEFINDVCKINISGYIKEFYITDEISIDASDHFKNWYLQYYTTCTDEDELIIQFYNPLDNVFKIVEKNIDISRSFKATTLLLYNDLKGETYIPSEDDIVLSYLSENDEYDMNLVNIFSKFLVEVFSFENTSEFNNIDTINNVLKNYHHKEEKNIDDDIFLNTDMLNIEKSFVSTTNYILINPKKYKSIYEIFKDIVENDLENASDKEILDFISNKCNFSIKYDNYDIIKSNKLKIKIVKTNDYYNVYCSENLILNKLESQTI